ncbi:hypothetical protein [Methylobacterium sp. SD21]|uniref:hypothetical protein n=1 Tax=Methylobacterium litchii TaxID=3138810 RepID=UPI00313D26BC
MRAFLLAVAMVAAAPAVAGVMDQDRWQAGTVERRGHDELTTSLDFVRTAPGEWKVRARCETRDTRNGRWSARMGAGVAVRSMGLVLIDVPPLGRLVYNPGNNELFGNARACAEGAVDLGTGD